MTTTESETVALVEAYKEDKSVHKVFEDRNIDSGPWKTLRKNQSVIHSAHDTGYSGRTKLTDLLFRGVQDFVNRHETELL